MENALMNTKQVAELLQVSTRQVDVLRQKNALPFIAVGGSIRFDRADVAGWLKSQRRGSEQPKEEPTK